VSSIRHGKDKEECGGGGAGPARWVERREGAGQKSDCCPAEGEREESSGGAVVQGAEKRAEKFLSMRERSRTLSV